MNAPIRIKICFLSIICLLKSCIEPYEPEIDKYDRLLVIDGRISNFEGSGVVKLSRSFPYGKTRYEVVSGAAVFIFDEIGNEERLYEVEEGTYRADSSFKALPGQKYKLQVKINENEVYESTMEKMQPPVSIDSLYFIYENAAENDREGVEINVDVDNKDKISNYYAWEYSEAWMFRVPHQSSRIPDSRNCFTGNRSKILLLGNSSNNAGGRLKQQPIFFISNKTNRLSIKYSVLVKQYTLTETAYDFYKNLKLISESSGTLFDPTPSAVLGNISRNDYPDQPVLGNFLVAPVYEKRLFIEKIELPVEMYVPTGFDDCQKEEVIIRSDSSHQIDVDNWLRKGYFILDTVNTPLNSFISLTSSEKCCDCKKSGSVEPPDFWIY